MSSATALEARVLGDFVLRDKLGEGGFGTVYRAEQRTLGRQAVVKVMRRSLANRNEAIERFTLEAKLASRFDHPYAAHIYAFGAEPDGLLWIAMELVRGTPLNEMIERAGRIPLDRFVPLMERLCEAVQSAHEQGIVHRDIKPSNVMVIARSGRLMPKLLDFGIAKLISADATIQAVPRATPSHRSGEVSGGTSVELDHTAEVISTGGSSERISGLTIEGQILGSPVYMAPEQWTDASRVGPWTDQYALAILAFEALSGGRAFGGTTINQLAAAHMHDPLPALPADIPIAVHAVLGRAAAKEPEARFPDLNALMVALRTAASPTSEHDEQVSLPIELLAKWSADAPRPIAESIAALATVRSPLRVTDRVATTARVIAHWIGALAIACRSRLGKLVATDEHIELIRELRKRPLREEEWIELAVAMTRPFTERPETWPIPELVTFLDGGEGLAALQALLRGDGSLVVVAREASVEHQTAVAKLGALVKVLQAASWMLDYELVRETAAGLELWMGPLSDDPVVRPCRDAGEPGRIVVLDADGARAVALSPVARIVAAVSGGPEQLFLLAGPGRSPEVGRYIALPHGFECELDDIWGWLADHVLDVSGGAAKLDDDERSPFPGLTAFTARDHASFVGREREVEELINRLRTQPMVAVVGPSGVGKSSFLAAGVVPALPAEWDAEVIRPGDDPVGSLISIVERGSTPYRDNQRVDVARQPQAIAEQLVALAESRGHVMVVVIDQGEELFTMCEDEERRSVFAEALAIALRSPRIRVVIGLRDDFFCRVEDLPPWRGVVARTVQILRTPGIDDLERIITVPARRRGFDFDDATLPRTIATEVADRPGALPLLAFAAAQLWEQRDRHFKRLTKAAYARIGGVSGALVQHADGVVEALSAAEQRLVRLAFRRLLTAAGTRAMIGRAELIASLGGTSGATRVVEKLVGARLIASRDDEAGQRIEIVHEALVTTWPRLMQWRREEDTDLRIHQQLATAARDWDARGRSAGLLWSGDALEDLMRWRARSELALTPVETAFADASERVRRSVRRRRLGIVATAFGALTTGVVVLGSLNHVVGRQRVEALQRLADSLAEHGRSATLQDDADRGLLYLTEARRLGATGFASDLLIARASTSIESQSAILVHGPRSFDSVDLDQATLVAVDDDTHVRILNRTTGALTSPTLVDAFAAVTMPTRIAVVSSHLAVTVIERDGTVVWGAPEVATTAAGFQMIEPGIQASVTANLVIAWGPTVRLWNLDDGRARGELAHDGARISAAIIDPAGERIATGDNAGTVRVWDARTAAPIATCTKHDGFVRSLVFSRDGKLVISGSDDRSVLVCDASTGAMVRRFAGHTNAVSALDVTKDGTIVSAGTDGTPRVWSVSSGELVTKLEGHRGQIKTARFSPDGQYVVTASVDGTARIWDVTGGTQLASLEGQAAVLFAAWEPDGRGIVTSGADGAIRRWDIDRAMRGVASSRHHGRIYNMAVSADDRWTVSSGVDGLVVWDNKLGAARATLHDIGSIDDTRISPDGTSAVLAEDSGIATLRSLPDGALIRRLADNVAAAGFTPDGRMIVTANRDRTLRMWDHDGVELGRVELDFVPYDFHLDPAGRWAIVNGTWGETAGAGAAVIELATKRVVARLRGSHAAPSIVAVDATRVAVNDDSSIRIYELGTWRLLHVLEGHKAVCAKLEFFPDGRLFSAGRDRTALVWSREGTLVASLQMGGDKVVAVAMRDDGTLFATGGTDGTVRIWDATDYRQLLSLASHHGAAQIVTFTHDGSSVVSAGGDGRVVTWDLRHPHRSLADLDRLVRCRVPYRFEGDELLPRDLNLDDPSCR